MLAEKLAGVVHKVYDDRFLAKVTARRVEILVKWRVLKSHITRHDYPYV